MTLPCIGKSIWIIKDELHQNTMVTIMALIVYTHSHKDVLMS